MTHRPSGGQVSTAIAVGWALVFALAVLGVRQTGVMHRVEFAAYDFLTWMAASGPELDPHVAVVEFRESDIQELQRWPLNDEDLAAVIERLLGVGARAVGIDIYRDIPVPPGTGRLNALLLEHPNVVWIAKTAMSGSQGVGPPAVLRGSGQVGFNNIVVDPDGISRRTVLFMEARPELGESDIAFPLLLALNYLIVDGVELGPDPDDPELVKIGVTSFEKLEPDVGSYVNTDVGGYQQLLDLRTASRAFPSMSVVELLEGTADPSIFEDKIVILLTVASSTPDRVYAGFDIHRKGNTELKGGQFHAHTASQIVRYALGDDAPIRTLGEAQEILLILFFSGLGATLGRWTGSSRSLAIFVVGLIFGLGYAGLELLRHGWWVPIMPIGIACLGSGGLVIADMRRRERAERAELMQLFSRHVAKEVAEDIWRHRDEFLEGGRPRPERVRATILFVDMKDFTVRADKLEPKDLMEWLNQFLDKLSRDVLAHGGHIEDFFGDGMMCAFGVPVPSRDPESIQRDAQKAVACALDMAVSIEELNETWEREGRPTAGIRVGICSGDIITGSMGTAERLKYSIVGDVVVTAQRLQSLDDSGHDYALHPCRILIGDQTLGHVGDTVTAREFGEHVLKGRSEPVMVYEVISSGETPVVV